MSWLSFRSRNMLHWGSPMHIVFKNHYPRFKITKSKYPLSINNQIMKESCYSFQNLCLWWSMPYIFGNQVAEAYSIRATFDRIQLTIRTIKASLNQGKIAQNNIIVQEFKQALSKTNTFENNLINNVKNFVRPIWLL